MNINSGDAQLVLLCPALKKWGSAKTVKPGTVILHSRADDGIPFAHSEELVRNSGLPRTALIEVGNDGGWSRRRFPSSAFFVLRIPRPTTYARAEAAGIPTGAIFTVSRTICCLNSISVSPPFSKTFTTAGCWGKPWLW
jgi:hypothetical protein